MRFAGIAKLFPQMSKGEALMRFAPDLLSAGFTAMSLPQDTPGHLRGLAGLEDLGIGIGASLLGGAIGGRAARAVNTRFGKNWDPAQVATIADMATTMPASMLMPRLGYNAALEQVYSKEKAQQEALQAFDEQQMQQQLALGGLTAGYGLGSYGLGLGGRML